MSFNPNSFPVDREEQNGESVADRSALWSKMLKRVRNEAVTAMRVGEAFGTVASLICLAGLAYWCPMCGGWHGNGPPPGPEPKPAPAVPEVIRKIVESETNVQRKPAPEPWPERGQVDGEPAKVRQEGDRIEALWDGNPEPDSGDHRHIASNDGLNANYVRDLHGRVIVDDSQADPYQPYIRDTSGRYDFE